MSAMQDVESCILVKFMIKCSLNSLKGCLLMLDYCDKCGWIWERNILMDHDNICGFCEICGNQLKSVPNKYYEEFQGIQFLSASMKQKLIEELVLTSTNFDQYYFDNAKNIKGQKDNEFNAKMEHGKAVLEGRDKGNKFGVECPYCHATNVNKITNTSKAVHTAIFGIFSMGRNSKNFHCNNCNSDF
jgi:hypothetical protein